MWVKLLLAVLIILFCTFLGYFAASKYRARKNFYGQFSAFNEKYLAELRFSRRPIGEFLEEQQLSGDFGKTVEQFAQSRKSSVAYPYLTQTERAEAENYFGMLGKGDSRSQNGFFSAQQEALSAKKSSAEKEAKERGELYLKLGLLSGLAFVILIV